VGRDGTSMSALDCQDCGACCVYGGEVTVMDDTDRDVPRYLLRSVRRMMGYFSDDHYAMKRMARVPLADMDGDHSRCAALYGEIGQSCRCKIYDRRPAVCREFQMGSDDCLQARREAGLSWEEPS
jgi:uncharacterized protein